MVEGEGGERWFAVPAPRRPAEPGKAGIQNGVTVVEQGPRRHGGLRYPSDCYRRLLTAGLLDCSTARLPTFLRLALLLGHGVIVLIPGHGQVLQHHGDSQDDRGGYDQAASAELP